MADQNFAQMVLSLLGRPGNAVRGALIDGPQGFGSGLSGEREYDPTELPGINALPDEGPSLGPLHLTPRTVGGFAASTALDPLTYVGPGMVGHGAEMLSGLGSLGRGMGEELTMRSLGAMPSAIERGPLYGPRALENLPGAKQALESARVAPEAAAAPDPMSSSLEDLVAHLGEGFSLDDEAAEAAVKQGRDGKYGPELQDYDARQDQFDPESAAMAGDNPAEGTPLFGGARHMSTDPEHLIENAKGRMQIDPAQLPDEGEPKAASTTLAGDNEETPVGDRTLARAQDKLAGQNQGLQELYTLRDQIKQYLEMTEGSQAGLGEGTDRGLSRQQLLDKFDAVLGQITDAQAGYKTNERKLADFAGQRMVQAEPSRIADREQNILHQAQAKGYNPSGFLSERQKAMAVDPNNPTSAPRMASKEYSARRDPAARYYNGSKVNQEGNPDFDPAATIVAPTPSGTVSSKNGPRTFKQLQDGLEREKRGGAPLSDDEQDILRNSKEDKVAREEEIARLNRRDPLYAQQYPEMPGMSHSDSVDAQIESAIEPELTSYGKGGAPDGYTKPAHATHSIEQGGEYDRYGLQDNPRDLIQPDMIDRLSQFLGPATDDGRDPSASLIRHSPEMRSFGDLVAKLGGSGHQGYTNPMHDLHSALADSPIDGDLMSQLASRYGLSLEELLRLARGGRAF